MSLYKMAVNSIFHFSELKSVRKVSFGKIVFYLVLLSLFLAIPITSQVSGVFNSMQSDGQKIAEKLPNFTIENNQLTTSEPNQGFIYQSDTLIFTFDPDGKRSEKDVSNDLLGNFLSIGMLKDKIIVSLKTDDLTSSLLENNIFEFKYNESLLKGLTSQSLKEELSRNHLPWYLYLITFLVAIYPSFFSLVFSILAATLFASIFVRLRDRSFTFFDTLKTMIVCATLPTLISMVFMTIRPSFDSGTFILIASFFIFFQMIRKLPKKSNQS